MATKEVKISDLRFDDKNFNKHTEFGMSLIEKPLRTVEGRREGTSRRKRGDPKEGIGR